MRDPVAVANGGASMGPHAVVAERDLRSRRLRDHLAGHFAAAPVTAAPRTEAASAPAATQSATPGAVRLGSFEAWTEFLHDHFPWLELRDGGGASFDADVTLYRVGGALFSTFRVGACEATRSRHLGEASRAGHIQLMWQLSSRTEAEQDGRSFRLEAGDVGVCDTSRPYRLRLSDRSRLAVLLVPGDAFPNWDRISRGVCGRKLIDGVGPRAALGALMSLNNQPADVVAKEGGPVLTAVKWMLSSALRGEVPARGGRTPGDTLMARARRHIAEHLADPALGPDQLASALGMSRRSLYLLFRAHRLTPSKLIHDVRLEMAKRSLEDPDRAHQKLMHLAFDAGFADYATFSRLFKAHFGVTPRDFRSQRRLAPCA